MRAARPTCASGKPSRARSRSAPSSTSSAGKNRSVRRCRLPERVQSREPGRPVAGAAGGQHAIHSRLDRQRRNRLQRTIGLVERAVKGHGGRQRAQDLPDGLDIDGAVTKEPEDEAAPPRSRSRLARRPATGELRRGSTSSNGSDSRTITRTGIRTALTTASISAGGGVRPPRERSRTSSIRPAPPCSASRASSTVSAITSSSTPGQSIDLPPVRAGNAGALRLHLIGADP